MKTRTSVRAFWILTILTSVVFAMIMCTAFASKPRTTQYDKLIVAYEDLLYRIWIDNPDYVLDVLSESPEWIVLSELKNNNWDYVFTYKSDEDSIIQSYNDNCIDLEDPNCYHHVDSLLDIISRKALKDYPSRKVPQIIIKNN